MFFCFRLTCSSVNLRPAINVLVSCYNRFTYCGQSRRTPEVGGGNYYQPHENNTVGNLRRNMATNASATARIQPKKQTLDDAYAPPANFLEIDLVNPETHGIGNKRYTDYELKMRVS